MFDVTRLRIRGPLSGSAPDLVVWLAGRGYRDNTIGFLARLFASLSVWLDAESVTTAELDWPQVDRFVAWCQGLGRRQPGSRHGVRPVVEFLIESGQVAAERFAAPVPTAGSAEGVARAFVDYLVRFRGITASTATSYEAFAVAFLTGHISVDRAAWDSVDAVSIQGFLTRWSATRSIGSAELMASVLRALLRFAFAEGWIGVDLSHAVGRIASRRGLGLVEGLTAAQAEQLIDSIDTATRIGARDKAVIVMLARLGLRAGEAARLRLDDIDWRSGTVLLRDPKGRRDRSLPLPWDVGAVLVDYLRVRQAPAGHRTVFLREHAPAGPLSTSGVSSIVADRAQASGLGLVHAHRLRHTAAMAVVARGGTLVEAGQLLGHARAATTQIYARTDSTSLRSLAVEWPEARDD